MFESTRPTFKTVGLVQDAFARQDAIADRPLALTVKLAALSYIDHLLPACNMQSLRRLVRESARV
jgi:hypothetical protein